MFTTIETKYSIKFNRQNQCLSICFVELEFRFGSLHVIREQCDKSKLPVHRHYVRIHLSKFGIAQRCHKAVLAPKGKRLIQKHREDFLKVLNGIVKPNDNIEKINFYESSLTNLYFFSSKESKGKTKSIFAQPLVGQKVFSSKKIGHTAFEEEMSDDKGSWVVNFLFGIPKRCSISLRMLVKMDLT